MDFNLEEEQNAAFGKAILKEISKRGFGSLTKNDYEVLIFHLLKENSAIPNNNFEISLALQIPESKVKRLSYEVELKYGRHSGQMSAMDFLSGFNASCITKDGDSVKFAIESKFFRNSLMAKLKSINHYGDYLMNTEVVSIKENAFKDLLNVLKKEDSSAVGNLVQACNSKMKRFEDSAFGKVLMELGEYVVKPAMEGAVSGLVGRP